MATSFLDDLLARATGSNPIEAEEPERYAPGALLMQLARAQTQAQPSAVAGGGGGLPGGRSLRSIADQYGWDQGAQWRALKEILERESGGNRFADNPNSTAYGRWQFLDSTWEGVGGHKTSNRRLQDKYGLKYIDQRYGSPLEALAWHDAHGWY